MIILSFYNSWNEKSRIENMYLMVIQKVWNIISSASNIIVIVYYMDYFFKLAYLNFSTPY